MAQATAAKAPRTPRMDVDLGTGQRRWQSGQDRSEVDGSEIPAKVVNIAN
jgi:hypothetical protein